MLFVSLKPAVTSVKNMFPLPTVPIIIICNVYVKMKRREKRSKTKYEVVKAFVFVLKGGARALGKRR